MGKNQIEVKDNHGHTTKVHRRDIKKIPMTDKISQIYEEEQLNKTRNGRKLVPENKMPNLNWNLEKQETAQEEEVQEIQTTPRISRIQKAIIYIIIFIYSYVLEIQNSFPKYVKAATIATQNAVRATKDISRTSWINIRKEMRTIQELLRMRQANLKNQSYRSCNSFNDHSPTQ